MKHDAFIVGDGTGKVSLKAVAKTVKAGLDQPLFVIE